MGLGLMHGASESGEHLPGSGICGMIPAMDSAQIRHKWSWT